MNILRARGAGVRALFAVALAAALFAAACGGGGTSTADYHAARVDPAFRKPDGILTDTRGQPFDIRKQTEGYITLFYIGYTHCPDVCPTHMHDIAKVLRELPPEVHAQTRVVFVTADPERDTPEALGAWLEFFDPQFIGLTGTRDQIGAILSQLNMNHGAHHDIGGGNYSVDHAAYVIAFTRDNIGRLVYPLGMSLEDWAHDLPLLVTKG